MFKKILIVISLMATIFSAIATEIKTSAFYFNVGNQWEIDTPYAQNQNHETFSIIKEGNVSMLQVDIYSGGGNANLAMNTYVNMLKKELTNFKIIKKTNDFGMNVQYFEADEADGAVLTANNKNKTSSFIYFGSYEKSDLAEDLKDAFRGMVIINNNEDLLPKVK